MSVVGFEAGLLVGFEAGLLWVATLPYVIRPRSRDPAEVT